MIRKHRRYTADDLMHAHLDGIASGVTIAIMRFAENPDHVAAVKTGRSVAHAIIDDPIAYTMIRDQVTNPHAHQDGAVVKIDVFGADEGEQR